MRPHADPHDRPEPPFPHVRQDLAGERGRAEDVHLPQVARLAVAGLLDEH
jgi:hypothetical protein